MSRRQQSGLNILSQSLILSSPSLGYNWAFIVGFDVDSSLKRIWIIIIVIMKLDFIIKVVVAQALWLDYIILSQSMLESSILTNQNPFVELNLKLNFSSKLIHPVLLP